MESEATWCVPILDGAAILARLDALEARYDILRQMFVTHAAVQTVAGDCIVTVEEKAFLSNAGYKEVGG